MKSVENHTIRVPSKFDSVVDIIVPYHGQYDKVLALIESIFKFTRSNYYYLYVVDDFSPNEAFLQKISKNANKKKIANLKMLRCSSQRGFAGACQTAYDRSNSPYVCFVNSDCLIEDIGWLRSLGESLLNLKPQGVKMVSARTNNPVNGDSLQKGEKGSVADDAVLAEGNYLSMYCFLCHRDLFPRCGGFLKNYPYGSYEDTEFGYRMSKHGYRQGVSGKSWVYHEGEATIKALWDKSAVAKKTMQEGNRQQCIEDMKLLK